MPSIYNYSSFNQVGFLCSNKTQQYLAITKNIYEKMLIVEFSYNFFYVWNYCTKLYDKHVPIYDNCVTSVFGQPRYAKKTFIENITLN